MAASIPTSGTYPSLELLRVPTAPGHEQLVAGFVRSWLRRCGISFSEDRDGNILARLRKGKARLGVAFSVHMDHPGWRVLKVRGKKLTAAFLGGVPRDYFSPGVTVEFFSPNGTCVARAKLQRLTKWAPPLREAILILENGEVKPGSFGMWKLRPFGLNSRKTHVVARACDDLAGCASVLAMLESLSLRRGNVSVDAIFTRREEVGLEGAFEVAKSRMLLKTLPIISVETSKALPNAPQGAGPIIRVGDRSSIFDPALTATLCKVGMRLQKERPGFIFQRKLMDGGTCEATAFLKAGFKAGGLCVALGNYHNCGSGKRIRAENIHLGDWLRLVEFMSAAALSMGK